VTSACAFDFGGVGNQMTFIVLGAEFNYDVAARLGDDNLVARSDRCHRVP
jgi:hypothetical protein